MFSSSDMRLWDIHNDSAPLLPGITHAHHIPPPETLQRDRIQPSTPPKYFLTFQGPWNVGKEGSSFVRLNLAAMLNSSKKPPKSMRSPTGETLPLPTTSYTPPADVFISIAGEYRYFKEFRQYHSLFDSSYSLVLHGHGRWSYRLMEVLNGQAIPVILAEGWTSELSKAQPPVSINTTSTCMCMYVYMYIYIYMCVCVSTDIHIST